MRCKDRELKAVKCIGKGCPNYFFNTGVMEVKQKRCSDCLYKWERKRQKATKEDYDLMYTY